MSAELFIILIRQGLSLEISSVGRKVDNITFYRSSYCQVTRFWD